jgi:hypothetical protein
VWRVRGAKGAGRAGGKCGREGVMEPEGTPARSPPLRCSSEGYPESMGRKGLIFRPGVCSDALTAVFTVYYLTGVTSSKQCDIEHCGSLDGSRGIYRLMPYHAT